MSVGLLGEAYHARAAQSRQALGARGNMTSMIPVEVQDLFDRLPVDVIYRADVLAIKLPRGVVLVWKSIVGPPDALLTLPQFRRHARQVETWVRRTWKRKPRVWLYRVELMREPCP
jgi:hypothetical protein